MLEAILTVCLLICAITIYWRARLVESRAHPLPPALPGLLPIIGHTHLLNTDATKLYLLMKNISENSIQQGGVIYVKFGSQIYYCISDPEDAVLVANACLEKHFGYSFAKYWLGEGLLTGSGSYWYRHRQMLRPSFSLPIINGYIEVFNSQSRALVSDVDQNVGKGKFYPTPYLRQFALRTSCLTTFGKVADENFCLKYIKAVDEMLYRLIRRFQKIWLHNDFMYKLFRQKKRDSELVTIVNGISDKIIHTKKFIDKTIRRPISSYVTYKPFVDQMLEQHTRDPFTDQEITEELHTAVVTAFDTTANTLETTLLLVGSFPEVQERMFEEIMQALGTNRDVTKEDLRKLVYTEAVIKESLRFIPTVPWIVRFVDKDVKLKNYTLRAGSQCILLLFGLQRHPSWGPDVDQFKPERWLDTATLPTNNVADSVFSFGKRSCIGKTYAMTAMKISVVHMVRNYFITADHTKIQYKLGLALKAVSGHEITLERRN